MDYLPIAFAAVVFVTVAAPGPAVVLVLTNGSRCGLRRACAGHVGGLALCKHA